MEKRAIAVVIDPVQSTSGQIVMDCFRSIDPMTMAFNSEPRISTSNTGLLKKHGFDAKIRGLNKLFYSMTIQTRGAPEEKDMLGKIREKGWV